MCWNWAYFSVMKMSFILKRKFTIINYFVTRPWSIPHNQESNPTAQKKPCFRPSLFCGKRFTATFVFNANRKRKIVIDMCNKFAVTLFFVLFHFLFPPPPQKKSLKKIIPQKTNSNSKKQKKNRKQKKKWKCWETNTC